MVLVLSREPGLQFNASLGYLAGLCFKTRNVEGVNKTYFFFFFFFIISLVSTEAQGFGDGEDGGEEFL